MQHRSSFGLIEYVSGVLFLLLSALTLLSPRHTLLALTPSFGLCIAISGMTSIQFVRNRRQEVDVGGLAISLVSGVFSIALGIYMQWRVSLLSITLLLPAWMILIALSYIINYRLFRPLGPIFFSGILICSAAYIVLGLAIIILPQISERTVACTLCAVFLSTGCFRIATAVSTLGQKPTYEETYTLP